MKQWAKDFYEDLKKLDERWEWMGGDHRSARFEIDLNGCPSTDNVLLDVALLSCKYVALARLSDGYTGSGIAVEVFKRTVAGPNRHPTLHELIARAKEMLK